MRKLSITLSIFIIILSACADDDSGKAGTANSATGNNSDNTTTATAISYNANGTWARDCRVFNKIYWELTTLDISGSAGTKYIDLFSSDQCVTPEMEYTFDFTMTTPYVFTNTLEGQALQIDIKYNSVKQTLLTKNMVALYNTNNVCGFNDWAIKQGRDVLDLSCFVLTQPEYDIFLIKESNQLFVGDTSVTNNGSTPDLRPTTLSTETYSRL